MTRRRTPSPSRCRCRSTSSPGPSRRRKPTSSKEPTRAAPDNRSGLSLFRASNRQDNPERSPALPERGRLPQSSGAAPYSEPVEGLTRVAQHIADLFKQRVFLTVRIPHDHATQLPLPVGLAIAREIQERVRPAWVILFKAMAHHPSRQTVKMTPFVDRRVGGRLRFQRTESPDVRMRQGRRECGAGLVMPGGQSSCKVYLKFTRPGIPEALWRPPQVSV